MNRNAPSSVLTLLVKAMAVLLLFSMVADLAFQQLSVQPFYNWRT
jgi:hypothetical protein